MEPIIDDEETQDESEPGDEKKERRFGVPFILSFLVLLPVWILLSGRFDLFHLLLGVISCLLVSYFSSDLLFSSLNYKKIPYYVPRFFVYIPWLIYQIFIASINVMYLVFHPRMMDIIDPKVFKFRSRLKDHLALATFANSITLTPGTITVYTTDFGDFTVHAIDRKSKEGLPGEMEEKIAKIFGY
jgi:multicomponent Na+:H+ antiporter subunit E